MSERLVDFLYILARDHLKMGAIEDIMWSQVDTTKSSYCNSYLEDYARDLVDRLLNEERPITDWKHMYKSPDGTERYWIDSQGNRTDAPYDRISDEAGGGAKHGSPRDE